MAIKKYLQQNLCAVDERVDRSLGRIGGGNAKEPHLLSVIEKQYYLPQNELPRGCDDRCISNS